MWPTTTTTTTTTTTSTATATKTTTNTTTSTTTTFGIDKPTIYFRSDGIPPDLLTKQLCNAGKVVFTRSEEVVFYRTPELADFAYFGDYDFSYM